MSQDTISQTSLSEFEYVHRSLYFPVNVVKGIEAV